MSTDSWKLTNENSSSESNSEQNEDSNEGSSEMMAKVSTCSCSGVAGRMVAVRATNLCCWSSTSSDWRMGSGGNCCTGAMITGSNVPEVRSRRFTNSATGCVEIWEEGDAGAREGDVQPLVKAPDPGRSLASPGCGKT